VDRMRTKKTNAPVTARPDATVVEAAGLGPASISCGENSVVVEESRFCSRKWSRVDADSDVPVDRGWTYRHSGADSAEVSACVLSLEARGQIRGTQNRTGCGVVISEDHNAMGSTLHPVPIASCSRSSFKCMHSTGGV
jgi:hypothetical protein